MRTHNGEPCLREQMDSVLAQGHPLHKAIAQYDQPADRTWEILEDYRDLHPCLVKLFRDEKRKILNRKFHTTTLREKDDGREKVTLRGVGALPFRMESVPPPAEK